MNSYPSVAEQASRRDERRRETDAERARRQSEARINKGIDWSVCVVPGCGRALGHWGGLLVHREAKRDAELEIPICIHHGGVIWSQMVRSASGVPAFVEAIGEVNAALAEREGRLHEERKATNLANVTHGDIYFIRLGELVKVGWTRDLWSRVKSYGAAAELLVSYPASRDDETNLHRQLTPARAKGREWYEDGAIIAKFVDEALARYGMPPRFDDMWTTPKQVVAGKRAGRYR